MKGVYSRQAHLNLIKIFFASKPAGFVLTTPLRLTLLEKYPFRFFSILASLKPDLPKVAYVSTGGIERISCFKLF